MGGGPEHEFMLVIFMDDEPKYLTDKIRKQFPYIHVHYHKLGKPQGKQVGGILWNTEQVPEELWKKATILVTLGTLPPTPELVPNLTLIHLLSAGIDHFLTHPIFVHSSIPITTVSGIHGPPISEWVLMTTLALTKSYNTMYENQKHQKWDSRAPQLTFSGDWLGRTVGIAGYGSIGRQVARVFKALGAKIHAYTATEKSTPDSRKDTGYFLPGTGDSDGTLPDAWYSGPDKAGLHRFLDSDLDLIVVCVPLTPSTRGMFSHDEFEVLYRNALKRAHESPYPKLEHSPDSKSNLVSNSDSPSAPKPDRPSLPHGYGTILSNISRGPIVDHSSLVPYLTHHHLLGAALDVTDPEPLPPDHPLWQLDNVIVTPHISALGREYLSRGFEVLIENLDRKQKGEDMLNEVNRGRGY